MNASPVVKFLEDLGVMSTGPMEEQRCDLISLVCHLRVSQQNPPEPTFYQLHSGFDPGKSSNPYINNPQKHYQEYNNPLYFSCGSPGHHATGRIKVNISSSRPTSNTTEAFTATIKNTAQSFSFKPVRTKVQQLETVVEDDEALFLGEYATQAEESTMKSFEITMILRI